MTPVLRYRNAGITLAQPGGDLPLVRGVDLDVHRNEIVALVGESGSGKTLTALSALGLLPKGGRLTADEAVLNGHDLTGLSHDGWRALRGAEVGIVFQEPLSSLNPVMSIGAQIGEVLYHKRGFSRSQRRAEARDLLARMGLSRPDALLDEYPHQLSGGMRQRAMLAVAMAGGPSLLIADEPTTALDNSVQMQVLELIVETAGLSGVGVLFITHDLSVVAQVADRVAVMRHGEIVESAPVSTLFAAPRADYTRKLIALAPRIPAVARDPEAIDAPPAKGAPLLELRNLTKTYQTGGVFFRKPAVMLAIDDVSLTVNEGETLGLVGESGSGKSSLARIVTGLSVPDSGTASFAGRNLFGADRHDRAHGRDIQMVFQDPFSSLNPRMRTGAIITEPLAAQAGQNRDSLRHEAETLLRTVGLSPRMADLYPHQMSGGQRQRVGIARALSVRPRLIVCDEPVSALDVSVQAEILALLKRLQEEFRLTTLFIAHGLDSVYAVSDRIAVMQKGRIVEHGHRDKVFGSPQSPYTRMLLDATLDSDPARSRFRKR